MKSVGVAEAKARLSELLGQVIHRGERVLIRRRGKLVAALVPVRDVERMDAHEGRDWLDSIVGLCADSPGFCDVLDQIVAERQAEMPRETGFAWEGEGAEETSPRR